MASTVLFFNDSYSARAPLNSGLDLALVLLLSVFGELSDFMTLKISKFA
jgi:hypothetical protein